MKNALWPGLTMLGTLLLPGIALAQDADGDGFPDGVDNCPTKSNPLQVNSDSDTYGDVCDNCPNKSNQSQADFDNDGIGDACDFHKYTHDALLGIIDPRLEAVAYSLLDGLDPNVIIDYQFESVLVGSCMASILDTVDPDVDPAVVHNYCAASVGQGLYQPHPDDDTDWGPLWPYVNPGLIDDADSLLNGLSVVTLADIEPFVTMDGGVAEFPAVMSNYENLGMSY